MKVDNNVGMNIGENQHSCECKKPTQANQSSADSLLKVFENINNREGSLVDSILGVFKNGTTEPPAQKARIKEPGDKSYQEVIRDFVKPGDDGKLGEKEMQAGLIKFSLYQYDKTTLTEFSEHYEQSNNLESSLSKIVDKGLIEKKDVDWIKNYTASASETSRNLDSERKVNVELSDNTRHGYDDIINWSEANLAHIVHGNVKV